jgi:hypothetical protein
VHKMVVVIIVQCLLEALISLLCPTFQEGSSLQYCELILLFSYVSEIFMVIA